MKYLALLAPTSIDAAAVTREVRRRCSIVSPLVHSGPINWPATCSAHANPPSTGTQPAQNPYLWAWVQVLHRSGTGWLSNTCGFTRGVPYRPLHSISLPSLQWPGHWTRTMTRTDSDSVVFLLVTESASTSELSARGVKNLVGHTATRTFGQVVGVPLPQPCSLILVCPCH